MGWGGGGGGWGSQLRISSLEDSDTEIGHRVLSLFLFFINFFYLFLSSCVEGLIDHMEGPEMLMTKGEIEQEPGVDGSDG